MKTIGLMVLLAIAAPAAAQDAGDVARAKSDLQARGVILTGACGAAKVTNLVAWRLRPAYGLLFKQGGNRAVLRADGSCLSGDESSEGGYATDYLIQRSTGGGFDLLGDGGGANNPQWSGPENDAATIARNFQNVREPLDPWGYYPTLTIPGSVVSTLPVLTVPPPAPVPTLDLSGVNAQLALLNGKLDALTANSVDAHETINRNITEGREENRSAWAKVATHWKSIVAIVGPVASFWVAKATGGQ